ncbi:hypothetical protein [Burkholderia thailandensis]|uniref:hypothetical protein n=1 Tax=Burkholderia thailandensis TaxID=57975 RepID=UPI000FDC6A7D|nr:hypothetical protein [Burkholderia thailandensis]
MFVQFSDADEKIIIAVFANEQDSETFPIKGRSISPILVLQRSSTHCLIWLNRGCPRRLPTDLPSLRLHGSFLDEMPGGEGDRNDDYQRQNDRKAYRDLPREMLRNDLLDWKGIEIDAIRYVTESTSTPNYWPRSHSNSQDNVGYCECDKHRDRESQNAFEISRFNEPASE